MRQVLEIQRNILHPDSSSIPIDGKSKFSLLPVRSIVNDTPVHPLPKAPNQLQSPPRHSSGRKKNHPRATGKIQSASGLAAAARNIISAHPASMNVHRRPRSREDREPPSSGDAEIAFRSPAAAPGPGAAKRGARLQSRLINFQRCDCCCILHTRALFRGFRKEMVRRAQIVYI